MNNWREILKKLGKYYETAHKVGVKRQNVSLWGRNNHVPPKHFKKINALLKEKGHELDILKMYEIND